MSELEPLDPETAVEMYLTDRRTQLAPDTLENHSNYLERFLEWCYETDVTNLNDLSGRDLHEYRQWRADDGLAQSSLQTQLSAARTFIRFCESIDAVDQDLSEKMLIPPRPGNTRDEKLDPERTEVILDYLETYEYATRDHTLFLTLWHCGMRMGSAQSLDVKDFDRVEQTLKLVHRPDDGTTLKNGGDGERLLALSEDATEVIAGYIDYKRNSQTDEHGREPLFTTRNGRISKNTIQQTVYRLTRPCVYTGECPHDRDTEDCEAMDYHGASSCPSSVSPHPVRRGSITWQLVHGPTRAVGDRCDVSSRVLDEHYDRRTERERMQQRREVLDI